MQNKGFVKFFAITLGLICLYYLSFSFVVRYQNAKAEKYAESTGNPLDEARYLDSISSVKVWGLPFFMDEYTGTNGLLKILHSGYTYKEAREQEINLGLDLKGGMNVIMEVSVPDVLQALAGENRTNEMFVNTLSEAKNKQLTSGQKDFVNLFDEAFRQLYPNERLATIFSTLDLKDKITPNSTNAEVISVLKSEIKVAVDNSFNVLRARIDRFGVMQPNIQQLEVAGRILIEMPGVKEPERIKKLLQGSAELEFWETKELSEIFNNVLAVNDMAREMESAHSTQETENIDDKVSADTAAADSSEASKEVDDLLAQLAKQDSTTAAVDQSREEFAKNNPLFAIMQLNMDMQGRPGPSPLIGTVHVKDTAKVAQYFRLAKERRLFPASFVPKWSSKAIDKAENIYELIAINSPRDAKAPLTGSVITDARADFGQNSNRANVSMQMNQEGARKWAQLTKENIGKSIAIVLDGYVVSYPRVNGEIPGGRSEITGNFTPAEAQDLATILNSGKMPAPARIVQSEVVGPSLGQEAIDSGFVSFIVAFVIILLYMICYYGLVPGLVVDASLIANVFFIFGVLASFQAVLTLPGIAGIVLTLAMAIDANVLIYERVREELRAGKQVKKALADGYKNALSTIIDANVTTVIVGIILFVFGTGPIRGFATTLLIGIFCSFFTAIFLTRLIFDRLLQNEKFHNLTFTTKLTKNFLQNIKFDFIGKRKTFYILTGSVIVIMFISLATLGLKMGIDFSGGRNYIVRFEEPVKTDQIREMLSSSFDGESVDVVTIGSNNQVRISTNFKIADNSEAVDAEITDRLYNGLKSIMHSGVTEEMFVSGYSIVDGQVISSADKKEGSFGVQSSQKVGPTMADDIKTSAIWAVVIALLGIGLYILIRFYNVSFSIGAVIALTHDALIIVGLYSLLYMIMPFSLEIDQSFIAAILTVVGYSINDKVVIFDRIREYVGLYPNRPMKTIINDAICSTMGRTFSTSFSTLLVLIVIFIFGGEVIRGFIFAMTVGVIVGTYSSVFMAAPISYDLLMKINKKKEEKKK
ncbi:MAG: protein translocase subunit SecDF [Prevotellaceae bacterium]|jgi:SecD/SecF fusion protein|nr:protein translocase subunit SecDF [Prevotellaceae bacterium]